MSELPKSIPDEGFQNEGLPEVAGLAQLVEQLVYTQ